jgi:hypothetical protein
MQKQGWRSLFVEQPLHRIRNLKNSGSDSSFLLSFCWSDYGIG